MKVLMKSFKRSDASTNYATFTFNSREDADKVADGLVYGYQIECTINSELFRTGSKILITFPDRRLMDDFFNTFIKHYDSDIGTSYWFEFPDNDCKEEKEMETKQDTEKDIKITLIQILKLIDPDLDSDEVVQIVRPNDGYDVFDTLAISSPLLIPFYDVHVTSIAGMGKDIIRVTLDWDSKTDMLNGCLMETDNS